MSAVREDHVTKDIEDKFKTLLDANMTDPLGGNRVSKTKFIVRGANLKRKIQPPHIVIEVIDMPSKKYAMGGTGEIFYPDVQFLVLASNKVDFTAVNDQLKYVLKSNMATISNTWLLHPRYDLMPGFRKLPFDEKNKTHNRAIVLGFTYFAI